MTRAIPEIWRWVHVPIAYMACGNEYEEPQTDDPDLQTLTIVTLLVNLEWIMQAANAQGFIIDQSNTVGGSITPGISTNQITTAKAGWRTQFRFRGSRHRPGVAEYRYV